MEAVGGRPAGQRREEAERSGLEVAPCPERTRVSVGFVPRPGAHGAGRAAHWAFTYVLALVRPTGAELDEEAARARRALDAHEVHALVAEAIIATGPQETGRLTALPPHETAGVIEVGTGVTGMVPAGRLTLARDGTVWWQHPGYYDTYIPAEGRTRDPALAAQAAVLTGGARTLAVPGDPPLYYRIGPGPCPT